MKFLYIFFFVIFCESVSACNIKFQNFFSSPTNLKINPPPIFFSDPVGGSLIVIPIEFLCKGEKDLSGTMVSFFYLDNELVQITLERLNFRDKKLMDLFIKKHGDFKRTLGVDKIDWSGNTKWENNDELVTYFANVSKNNLIEVIQATSKKHSEKMAKYFNRKELWKK